MVLVQRHGIVIVSSKGAVIQESTSTRWVGLPLEICLPEETLKQIETYARDGDIPRASTSMPRGFRMNCSGVALGTAEAHLECFTSGENVVITLTPLYASRTAELQNELMTGLCSTGDVIAHGSSVLKKYLKASSHAVVKCDDTKRFSPTLEDHVDTGSFTSREREEYLASGVQLLFRADVDDVSVDADVDMTHSILRPTKLSGRTPEGCRNAVSVPIAIKGQLWGLMLFFDCSELDARARHDCELAGSLISARMEKTATTSVLIVEDSRVDMKVMSRMLSHSDLILAPVKCYTAEDALETLENKEDAPDVILADVNLGKGMDGVNFIRKLRRTPKFSATRVVFCTGDPTIADACEELEADLLQKPYTKEKLLSIMK